MSLLFDSFEPCVLLDKKTVSDGRGGFIQTWTDGVEFGAAFDFDTTTEARIGGAQGATDRYKVYTDEAMNLQYHDVFRRLSNGKTYRATQDSEDKKTPPSASFHVRQVSAEEWVLTGD